MFRGPLEKVTYEDFKAFTDEYPEGVRVEYKQDFGKENKNIKRPVSAMANTFGGIVIIGVEADKTANRVIDIPGIDYEAGIQEKITSACLDGIYPPIVPEVTVLTIPKQKGKCVVLIRVVESPSAPHAINNSTKILIRVGEITSNHEFHTEADLKKIEYLIARKNDQEIIKERNKALATKRVKTFISALESIPHCEISIRPFTICQPMLGLQELKSFADSFDINQDRLAYSLVQNYNQGHGRGNHCIFNEYRTKQWFEYLEINTAGDLFHRRALETGEKKVILASQIQRVLTDIKLINRLYERKGHYSQVDIELTLHYIRDYSLILPGDDNRIHIPGSEDTAKDLLASSTYSMLLPAKYDRDQAIDDMDTLFSPILWVLNREKPPRFKEEIQDLIQANAWD